MLKKSNRYIPFFTPEITSEEIKSLNKTVKDGWISSQGKIIERFEEELQNFIELNMRYQLLTAQHLYIYHCYL